MNTLSKPSNVFAGVILMMFTLLALLLGYFIIQPLFIPLLFASLFAVVFTPLYDWLRLKTKSEVLSSVLTCLVLAIGVISLLSFAIYLAVGEVVSVTKVFTENFYFQSLDFLSDQRQLESMVDQATETIEDIVGSIPYINASLSEIIAEVLKNIPPLLQNLSSSLISFVRIGFDSATNVIFNLVIFFIAFFFLLIDGKKFLKHAFDLLPINALHERQITKRFSNLCFSWVVVSFLLAFIQGALAAIGFAIIGVPSPLIWGIVTIFASFIPFIGSGIIWVTISIIYLILGKYGAALFIFIWGAVLISSSDNILRPFLLKGGLKMHPLLLFIAVLGGFFSFGVTGLILGPIIMVFISTLLYIYELEFGEALKGFHKKK